MSLTRACLGIDAAGSEAKALGEKTRRTANTQVPQEQELPPYLRDTFDTFDLFISARMVPR
jgi:hypothetical protein